MESCSTVHHPTGYSIHRSRRVLLDQGPPCEAAILVAPDGTISKILAINELPPLFDGVVNDYGNAVLMAGVVDSHVHLNEPGRTDWEGFWSGTRAAAAGGVTTLVDMPLNSIPPTTTVAGLREKRKAAQGQCHVDVAFWGGLVPDNLGDLQGLIEEGVVGFKCFLIDSGVPEFPPVTEDVVRQALGLLKPFSCPLAFHAELPNDSTVETRKEPTSPKNDTYGDFETSRPPSMEVRAIQLISRLCEETRSSCHVVHVSAADAVPVLRAARERGAPLTAETCPHYLSLVAEDVPQAATHYKCCPPVRGSKNRELLWSAVLDSDLQLIVSDHSPCPPAMKLLEKGNFQAAWGGISSLQLGLALTWSIGRELSLSLQLLSKLMSENPARLCGLHHCKGRLVPGYHADMVVWDPETEFEVTADMLHHKHKLTPYLGLKLHGQVLRTIVRGQTVYDASTGFTKPCGTLLIASHTSSRPNI